jgi:small subunit ribosomal protein S20
MPHTRAAKRALRKSQQRRLENRSERSALRTQTKNARAAIQGKTESMAEQVRMAASKLDKAAKKHLIHPNKAARLKSRLARAANATAGAKPVQAS